MTAKSLAWIFVLLTGSVAAAEKPEKVYLELVKKASAGDAPVDFRELRLACSRADNCDPKGERNDLIAMRQASQTENHKEVVRIAEKMIAAGFPNIEAHAVCANAYAALNDPEKAKFHQGITSALLRSIMTTGDGRSKATAFEVIGTHEEYIVLSVLGFRPGSQALIADKPHSYDMLKVSDPKTGENVTLYFNIDAFYPMKGLR